MYANTGTARLSYTRKMTMLAVLGALAYIIMVFIRIPLIPAAPFIKYDPKDVLIAFGGLLFGPVSAFLVSLVVSLVEMVTVSESGPIGMIMNLLSTCAFVCTASVIYKRKQNLKSAVIGLASGVVLMVGVMLLWNYLITPIYMGVDRAYIAGMLLPAFLPFNLIKGTINATLILLLYKPLVNALRAANLLPPREMQDGGGTASSGKFSLGVMLVAGLILISCVLVVLVLQGVL